MPATAGTMTDTVLQRIYDAGGVATARANVWDMLSRCQQLVNAALDSIIVALNFSTGPRQQVFTLTDIAPDVMKVLRVRDQHRDLSEIQLRELKYISPRWFGQSGSRWETFAKIGKTMLVVHPMKLSADSLTLVYTQILPRLGGDLDVCPLSDDQIPLLTKLTEAMLLLRQRNFEPVKKIIDDVVKDVQAMKLGGVGDGKPKDEAA